MKTMTHRVGLCAIGIAGALACALPVWSAGDERGPTTHPAADTAAIQPAALRQTLAGLGLNEDQRRAADLILKSLQRKQQEAQNEALAQMKRALSPAQYEQLAATLQTPGTPTTADARGGGVINGAMDGTEVPAVVSGGYDTDRRDGGRPAVLIAAALGVPTDTFRQAFSGVTPARGGERPSDAQVRRNKDALMRVLEPLGVTNDRLDEVSNHYRYRPGNGELWQHTPAKVTAIVRKGSVVGFKVIDPGAGYSSAPTITVPTHPAVKTEAALGFGTDLRTNGAIRSIAVLP